MRSLIWTVILFALAAAVAVAVKNFDGSAMFLVGDTLIRMNLNTLIAGILLVLLLLYVLYYLLRKIFGTPRALRRWNKRHNRRRAEEDLNEIGMAFFTGRYQHARQLTDKLLANREIGSRQPFALVLAAYSAQKAGDAAARDAYLQQLAEMPEKHQLPRHLLLAEDALANGDYAAAQTHIQAARKISPDLTQVIKLDLRCAMERNDAQTVMKYLHQLRKNGAIGEKEAESYRYFAYRQMLEDSTDAKTLKAGIKKIPEDERGGTLNLPIAEAYLKNGQYRDTVRWVKKYYPQTRNSALLAVMSAAFPYLNENEQNKTFETAEGWLKEQPRDVHLLNTLGRLAAARRLWGKAQSYLEAGLSVEETVPAHLLLSEIFADTDKPEAAARHRELALALVAAAEDSDTPDLPAA